MDAHYPHRILRHAKSSQLQGEPANAQQQSHQLRKLKSAYFPQDTKIPRKLQKSRSTNFQQDTKSTHKLQKSKSAYFHQTTKTTQDRTPLEDKTTETKTHHTLLSKIKAAFKRTSRSGKHKEPPSQLMIKLQMTRLEYRLHALTHYRTPKQYHRIHLAAILFHPITHKLLLIRDPIGNKFTIPETAMFARHSSLGEALSEALYVHTGLRVSEVKREVLPAWEFRSSWRLGDMGEETKSVMLTFVVGVRELREVRGDVWWVGEEEVQGLEMDRGMKNLVRWVFDERILEG